MLYKFLFFYANSKTRLLIIVGVLCKLVCNLYKFANYTALGKWRLEKKSHDPAPEPVAYALTQSFSHASHRFGRFFVSKQAP